MKAKCRFRLKTDLWFRVNPDPPRTQPVNDHEGTVNLSNPEGDFRRFASAIRQVACDV
jgi:hypothetical protein